MEATGRSTAVDTPYVVGGMVLLAVLGLFLLNRLVANVNLNVKAGS